ncbi:MAG: hypothetical protein IBX55_08770 [Methyloprofundus sp.]|nr:hypothetical protein [Methyloprofundus sp.]
MNIEDFDLNLEVDTEIKEDFDFSDVQNLSGFDLSGFHDKPKKNPLRETRIHKPKLSKKVPTTQVKYKNAVKLQKKVNKTIFAGGRVDAVVSGDFIFGDFIEALIVNNNLLVDDLTISTLSLSKDNVDSLANLINGDFVSELNIIVSDYFYSHNLGDNIRYIYEKLDSKNSFQLAVASNHTKICLLRSGDIKMVIHGSANFRSSACVEMFTVETDSGLYDFHKTWHDDIIEQYKTIKKPIRKRDPIGCE